MIIDNEYMLMNEIKEALDVSKVYIYGAGSIGKLLDKRLKFHGISIQGFCVSNKSESDHNKNIYSFDEIAPRSFFVVAAKREFRNEIIEHLKKAGCANYLEISDKLIKTMQRLDGRKLRFQTHLAEHCNLNCRGCYHFSPLAKEELASLDEFERDLSRLSELFDGRAEEILLLGGEPLLHPNVIGFMETSRRLFPIGTIKILTNGVLLLKKEDSFYKALLEYDIQLWVTKYPVDFDYDEVERKAAGFDIQIRYFNQEPIRTLGHQPLDISGRQNAWNNFVHCYRANSCVDLKHGKMYPCILPAEIKPFKEFFGLDIDSCEQDYIDIYSVKDADELLSAMERPIPFCRYCNRENIAAYGWIPWSCSRKHIEEWTE